MYAWANRWASRVCMGQEVGNLKESMHWHLHHDDGRPVRSAWRARLRQPPVLHQHVGHGLAHRLLCCRPLKKKTEFQNKGSLVVCSATRHAQCIPTAHIQSQVNSGSHLIHTDTCKYMHIQHAHQIMSLDA